MDIKIEFAECDGIEMNQLDAEDSGFEVTSATFDTYVVDGRRVKTITIRLMEVERAEELTDGEDFQATDNSSTPYPAYGTGGSAYCSNVPRAYSIVDGLGNRR